MFDTALSGITIGLGVSNESLISHYYPTEREQAALLIPHLQEVLVQGRVTFQNLDAIACTIGPGSFTGLRIGMTTAKILALSLQKPVVGINTLDLMARHYKEAKNLLIVLETKRQDFYACYYNQDREAVITPFAASASDIIRKAPFDDFVVGGDCLDRFKKVLKQSIEELDSTDHLNSRILVQLATEYFDQGKYGERIEPLYLRGADVSQPKNKPRKIAKA